MSYYLGLLFHLIGDYLFQNDWMANEKTRDSKVAVLHAVTYSALFLFIVSPLLWLIIFITHFLIDRFRLATYWIKLVNWNWKSTNFGYANDKPKWMSVWLMIIVDNIFHILINSLTIYLQTKI